MERNIARMVAQVGGDVSRLRPHVKTHKMAEVVRLQREAGIDKFKCATLAEAEMLAAADARDVLLAYQPVGPNVWRLRDLVRKFPDTSFAALVDEPGALAAITEIGGGLRLFVDVDCGMARTGVAGGALEVCRAVRAAEGVEFAGLHVYDGHLRETDLDERRSSFEGALGSVKQLVGAVQPDVLIGGGSPTFGLHALDDNWECSPGTTIFWDIGYAGKFPDLDFEIAAGLLARVISRPGRSFLCIDVGHKAVGSENPLPDRIRFPGLPDDMEFVQHSEEHLVVETRRAGDFPVGSVLLGLPVHICPTVALHQEAVLVSEAGEPTGDSWAVAARDRRISI